MLRYIVPVSVALALVGASAAVGQVYWGDETSSGQQYGFIYRANSDGSNPELQLQQENLSPWYIAVDPIGGFVYWLNLYPGYRGLYRAGLDIPDGEDPTNRSDIEQMPEGLPESPHGITIDAVNRTMYVVGSTGMNCIELDTWTVAQCILEGDVQFLNAKGVDVVRNVGTIPAISEWGMVTMTLLVLTAGTLVFVRKRQAA